MSETRLATPALWAGEGLSLQGDRYSGQYWVSRHLAPIVSLTPTAWAWKFTDCLFPTDRALCPCQRYAYLPLFPARSHSHGADLQELGDNDLWMSRCLLRDFPCRSHSNLQRSRFSPVPWTLKQVALLGPFLWLGRVWQEEGKSFSIGVERTWLRWSIFCPWVM